MNYTCEVLIEKPIRHVVTLFSNPDNLKHWQEGFVSFEHLSGTPGQPGAKSRLKYRMGNRDLEMIETVTENDLPRRMSGTYEMDGTSNVITCRFEEVYGTQTKFIFESDFQFKGFVMKMIGFFMPGMFKKQSMKYLTAFKAFCEKTP